MKVLLLYPMEDQQTGLFIKNGFLENGCDVLAVDAKTELKYINDSFDSFDPDMVFSSRTPQMKDNINYIKSKKKIPMVCYNNDPRFHAIDFGRGMMDYFNMFDIFYTKPKGLLDEYRRECPNPVIKWLPEGMDPTLQKKETPTQEDLEKYQCEVLFIGTKSDIYKTPRPYGRIGLIEFLKNKKDIDFKTIGFDSLKERIYNSAHNRACACAKIVLGHCGFATVSHSNSYRDFIIPGCGSFFLTEYVKDMEEMYKIGEEIEVYKTPEECYDKIKYYLNHDEERNKIAERGYLRVRKDHTFKQRMKIVLDDVESFLHGNFLK